MDKKSTVSDAAKAEAAKMAAAAKKAAEGKKSAPKSSAAKPAPKKAPAVKAEAPEPELEEVEQETEAPASGGKGSVKGLRLGAVILWILALAAEVGAFFAFSYAMRNSALTLADLEMQLLIGALVLDAIFCIVAAQLWKKSNRIKPCLSNSKLVRTLWHQLGVIMVLVCFLPIGIFLLAKSDKLNKKTKTILIALLAVLFVGAGAASVDYHQPSDAEVAQLQQAATAESTFTGTVYWTRFGSSYHFSPKCQALSRTKPENLFSGTLEEAFAAHRYDPCDFCAGGAEAKADEAGGDTTGADTAAEQPAG